jgi:hypothetical protein
MWTAALVLGAAMAVQAAPTSRADVCGDVGGRHVSVGGCTDPGANVDDAVPPPPESLPPPPEDVPPPLPPAPDATACADVGGRHVSVGGCA